MTRNVQPARARGDAEGMVKKVELSIEAINKKVEKLDKEPQRKDTHQVVLTIPSGVGGVVGKFISGIKGRVSGICAVYDSGDPKKKYMIEIKTDAEKLVYVLEDGNTVLKNVDFKIGVGEIIEFRVIEPTDITLLSITMVIEA
jgi:hypothetical protein